MFRRKLRTGDFVRVRSQEEILSTVDAQGCLDGMPIMPEMLRFCGQTIRVEARAHKTCDTVSNIGGVWVDDAVHLEGARCDGASHDGCQASCLLFWKGAWVERISDPEKVSNQEPHNVASTSLPREWSYKSPPGTPQSETIYRCQATEIPGFSRPMKWWDIRQYIEDLTSRNIGLGKLFRGMWDSVSHAIISLGIGYRVWKRIYNGVQRLRGADLFYWETGELTQTPSRPLGLKPGDWVRIKPFEEIMETLDTGNKNRGMGFDTGEMGMYCGRETQVDQRLEKIINERNGKMVFFREPTVTLQGIYCSGERSNVRKFCPRAIQSYWRETWLEQVDPADGRNTPD